MRRYSGETDEATIDLLDNMEMLVAPLTDDPTQIKTLSYIPMAPGGLPAGISSAERTEDGEYADLPALHVERSTWHCRIRGSH
jgi:hypothetical protein